MEKKLIEWFNKTGYPFELWTEAILSDYDFFTESSSLYKDPEQQIYREIDLVATRDWVSTDGKTTFTIKLIIECKKSDKPFVLLGSKIQKDCKVEIGEYYDVEKPISRILWNNKFNNIMLPKKSSYGFKLTQGFVKGDETCHKAITTLIKSFNESLNNEKEYLDDFVESNQHIITLPLLLIDSPFYELSLDVKNQLKIDKIDSGIISTITHLNNSYPDNFEIPIITKESLETFLKSVEFYGQNNLDHLIENPLFNLKNLYRTKITIADKIEIVLVE